LARIARTTGAARACGLALLAAGLAGCGGVTGGRVALGYPTARPVVKRASSLQTRLDGNVVRLAVPAGWGLARLDTDRSARPAFVLLDGDCYLSVSITGSSTRMLTAAGVAALYAKAAGGYDWTVTHVGSAILALLGEQNATTGRLSRSSLGTVYLPMQAGAYLAIDFGAGVWPLDGHACPDDEVGPRLATLTSATEAIFGSARLAPGTTEPAALGGAPSPAGSDTASAPLTVSSTSVTVAATSAGASRAAARPGAARAARIDPPASA
jgi:hypothetical protein